MGNGHFQAIKSNQRCSSCWHIIDHSANTALTYVFGKRKDEVVKALKALLESFGITAMTLMIGCLWMLS